MQVIYMVKNKLLALCIISHIKRIPVTVYHLLLWSLRQQSAPSWWDRNQDSVKMSSVKKCFAYAFNQFCGALVPKSPLLIDVNQMLPMETTLLPEMTQADLEKLTAWPCTGEEKPRCCCVLSSEFKYHMHTNFCEMYILWIVNEWGFPQLYFPERYFV